MTDKEFLFKENQLKAGYALWQSILAHKNLSDKDYVIAFPHEEDPVNECGIAHLKQFMVYGSEEKKRLLVLCVGKSVPELIHAECDEPLMVVDVLNSEEMETLVTLYSITTISSHFIMMSLTKPYGRYGDRALKKGMTLDEIVTVGIYGMTGEEVFDKHKS